MPTSRRTFLPGFRKKDDVAIERHVEPLEHQHHHQRRNHVVLVVERPTPVDVSIRAGGTEWRMRPLGGIDTDDVGMRHQEDRALAAVSFQTRHDIGTMRLDREHLDRNPVVLEHLAHVVGRRLFVAWRVARVEPNQRLKMAHRFFLERGPVGRFGLLAGHPAQQKHDRKARRQGPPAKLPPHRLGV